MDWGFKKKKKVKQKRAIRVLLKHSHQQLQIFKKRADMLCSYLC